MHSVRLKNFGTFIIVCLFGITAQAQNAKQYFVKGQEAEDRADFYAASEIYKQAKERFPDNVEFGYRLAESYRMYNDYARAAEAYKNVVTDDVLKNYPHALFWQGMMTKQQGKYEAALKLLERFKLRYRGTDEYAERVKREIVSCKWAIDNKKNSDVNIVHLDKPINSEYSDFNPFTDNANELFFSSMRDKENDFFSRIYRADASYENIKMWLGSTSKTHVANGAFNDEMSEMFYSACDNDRCFIAYTTTDIVQSAPEDSSWKKGMEVTIKNMDNTSDIHFSNTQPHLAKINGTEYLFFSSNHQKGKGGFDLYRAKRIDKNTFAEPENLTAINTSGNEYTPFFDADSNKVFFASDSWNGYGGLDIYSISIDSLKGKATPQNLGYGINSEANDYNYALSSDNSKAYFASNRKGSFFIKAETCCYDLWYYETGRLKSKEKTDTLLIVSLPPTEVKITDTLTTSQITTKPVEKTRSTERVEISTSIPPKKYETPDVFKDFPITLYFHNDEPECCNLRDTTALNYVTTYQAYWVLLNDYKRSFSHGLQEDKKAEAEAAIFNLFTEKVEKGMRQMIPFSAKLLETLQAGKKVTLTIKGFCSPLNYNQYNIQLGYRRIASVKNYFYQYRSGILKPFIDNGSLILKNESIGEETAATTISDQREDTRNSVYNPVAAQERRVEIVSVTVE